jgi:hypothetical protein
MRKTILKTFTVLWLMGMYIVLLWTFMAAYASPAKSVRVAIDLYNEAHFEFYMLVISLGISLIGTLYIIGDIKNDFLEGESLRLVSRDSD